uniref:Uncharacterized protein n=1 Tax=Rhizophagus irregularis (strain DAOM 181602 / DAOM 197198 / MUCL 43194) TaxID=747089 RepID=U9TDE9_RHIID
MDRITLNEKQKMEIIVKISQNIISSHPSQYPPSTSNNTSHLPRSNNVFPCLNYAINNCQETKYNISIEQYLEFDPYTF